MSIIILTKQYLVQLLELSGDPLMILIESYALEALQLF